MNRPLPADALPPLCVLGPQLRPLRCLQELGWPGLPPAEASVRRAARLELHPPAPMMAAELSDPPATLAPITKSRPRSGAYPCVCMHRS